MTNATKENRDIPEFAASLMEALCQSQRDRTLVLRQLLESIDVAKRISPNIWALTMLDRGFRLNVGPVEVMTFRAVALPQSDEILLELRLLLHGQVKEDLQAALNEDEDIHSVSPSHYASVPQPQFLYMGLGDISNGSLPDENYQELEKALELLQPLHASFIVHAAKSPSGKVRKSSNFRRSHSSGLHAYAESFVRGSWRTSHEPNTDSLLEGGTFSVQATVYERNPMARKKCIAHYGTSCSVCGFSFGVTYGNSAEDYIHVHHLKPIASIGQEYVIDPIEDLRPVCANCHAVIHLRQPPYSIEEVKEMRLGDTDA